MNWDCQDKIDQIVNETKKNVNNYIEMLYIQSVSKIFNRIESETDKALDSKLIEDYLKKRGYTMNYLLGIPVMVKSFTCVHVQDKYVELWHDKIDNRKSIFVNKSILTGLPITLDYMERI